jgi:hypothetical protein
MAARTTQANDAFTLLHNGQVTVSTVGFTAPGGTPWLVMNDVASAVNGLQIANSATGNAVTIGVGGPAADANPALSIFQGSSTGTGLLTIGSSTGTMTLSGTVTVSSTLNLSSNLVVTGNISASTITSCGLATVQSIAPSSNILAAIQIGSSGPRIFWGASTPTSSARAGDLFLNTGGASAAIFAVGLANAGTASSSNWATYSPA